TIEDYCGAAQRLLGYEYTGSGPLRTMEGWALTELLGIKGVMKRKEESMEEYLECVRTTLEGQWSQEAGSVRARRELRIFLLFVLSRLLLSMKGSLISLRYLSLLMDLSRVGDFAWGAAVLAELFYGLSPSRGETGVSGFNPLLQVHSYSYLKFLCTIL